MDRAPAKGLGGVSRGGGGSRLGKSRYCVIVVLLLLLLSHGLPVRSSAPFEHPVFQHISVKRCSV